MGEIRAASVWDLKQGMTAITLAGEKLLLVRDGDDIRAFEGTCPHAKAPLAEGALCHGRIVCPWHMGAFDAHTGALLEPVAMRALHGHAVRITGDDVFVDTTPTPDPAATRAPDHRVFALVGTGAASAMAATTLRERGFTGRILLIGPDPAEPLDRTQLSKMAIAAPDFDRSTLPLLDPAITVERIPATITALDPAARRLTLFTGESIHYDAALLATGAVPKPPNFPGAEHAKLLRTLRDVDAILPHVREAAPAVVIGASFIGMEAASALTDRGMRVTVVGEGGLPFAKQFGDRVGAAIKALHESKGVRFRLGAKVDRIDPDAVLLASGERLPAALVIAGLGVTPVLDYAGSLLRAEDDGLITDASLQAAPGLWAAGDIATPAGWPRIEHWRLAQQHGRIAALGMLGEPTAYDGVPFFWSAQAGKRLQSLGHAADWDEAAYDGDVEAFDFTAWYLTDGHVTAALICGRDRAAAILSDAMRHPLTLAEARTLVA